MQSIKNNYFQINLLLSCNCQLFFNPYYHSTMDWTKPIFPGIGNFNFLKGGRVDKFVGEKNARSNIFTQLHKRHILA